MLKNNNFVLLVEIFNQVLGTAMVSKLEPPTPPPFPLHANLSVGLLWEIIFFPVKLKKRFFLMAFYIGSYCIEKCLNKLHQTIKFPVEPPKIEVKH